MTSTLPFEDLSTLITLTVFQYCMIGNTIPWILHQHRHNLFTDAAEMFLHENGELLITKIRQPCFCKIHFLSNLCCHGYVLTKIESTILTLYIVNNNNYFMLKPETHVNKINRDLFCNWDCFFFCVHFHLIKLKCVFLIWFNGISVGNYVCTSVGS